jgi:PAS domain S-box-containing protein
VDVIDRGIPVPDLEMPEMPPVKRALSTRVMSSVPAKLALSVLAPLAAFLIRNYITRHTGTLPPFIIYNPTVVAIALWAGVWYGVTATAMSALLVCYWVLPPVHSFYVSRPADAFTLGHFCVVGVLTSLLAEMYRRGQQKFALANTERAVADERKVTEEQKQLVDALEAQAIRLRDAEQLLSTMVDFVPQMVWMCTPDGDNVYFNKRWVDYTGLSLEETSGSNWSLPFHPEDQPIARAAWQAAVSSGGIYEVEARLRAADGSYRWHLVRGTPMRSSEGIIQRWFGTCTDIEDQKRAQEALIRSEKLAAVGRLASAIAHEINNPLEAVTNALYLARGTPGCPGEICEFLDIADEELQRVAHVTRQTLGFYREAVSPIAIPLTKILDSAVDLHRRKIVERNATVLKQYRGDFDVTAIPAELRQVFSNLLANSLDAIEVGGQVSVRTSLGRSPRTGAPQLRIIVADTGSGIDPDSLKRIFEPLFTTKIATGSGLGLWVVRQLLEKHGGAIAVRTSTSGPRRGTLFAVTLPQRELAPLDLVQESLAPPA